MGTGSPAILASTEGRVRVKSIALVAGFPSFDEKVGEKKGISDSDLVFWGALGSIFLQPGRQEQQRIVRTEPLRQVSLDHFLLIPSGR